MKIKTTCLLWAIWASFLTACGSNNESGDSGVTPEPPLVKDPVTYYIDADRGNDNSAGTSAEQAWRTLSKASTVTLQPGDRLLLRRGQTHTGELDIKGTGTESKPILVTGYGTGANPVVKGYDYSDWAVRVKNSSWLTLRGLEVVNTGKEAKAGRTGVKVECMDHGISAHLTIDSLFIHDVNGSLVKEQGGGSGILIQNGGQTVASRFDGLTISNCHVLRCQRNGIIWTAYYDRHNWLPNLNVVVRDNLIEQVPGDGIVPIGCDGALVEYNVMRDCPATLPASEAAAGIWPWSCDNTVIQFNEVSGHKAPWDSQGYDCDYNCRNTVIQYNYSHDNYGGMVLICDSGNERYYSIGNDGSIVRYNISIGDGVRPVPTRTGQMFSPSIHIAGRVTNTTVANNIIHANAKPTASCDRTMICSDSWDGYADNTQFTDNIFYSAEESRFQMTKSTRNTFQHNWYLGKYEDQPADGAGQTSSRCYEERITGTDAQGYTALEALMTPTLHYGVEGHTVDKEKIEQFFRTMNK